MKYNFHILMGLPGSGKTYFAISLMRDINKTRNVNKEDLHFIDLDKYKNSNLSLNDALFKSLNYNVYRCLYKTVEKCDIIIDGLILTFDDLTKTIETCLEYFKPTIKDVQVIGDDITVNIHHWNEDRETCLNNDNIRVKINEREKSSAITIRNAKFDNVELYGMIKNPYNIKFNVIKHNVYHQDEVNAIFQYYIDDEYNLDRMTSEEWSLGGDLCNCWGNSYIIEPDPTPKFTKFDELILKICPDIKHVQYEELYNKCVYIEDWIESDYYGGSQTMQRYVCRMNKLHNMLKEMKLI